MHIFKITYFLLIFLLSNFTTAQDAVQRNQIGINGSKFILIFNEQVEELDISYRRLLSKNIYFRSAFTLDLQTGIDGLYNGGISIGLDKQFKSSKNWNFYYGGDLSYTLNKFESSKQKNTSFGIILHFGAIYFFGEHFSISTEPSLGFYNLKTEDENSFNPNANRSWWEMKFLRMGQIQLNFHF